MHNSTHQQKHKTVTMFTLNIKSTSIHPNNLNGNSFTNPSSPPKKNKKRLFPQSQWRKQNRAMRRGHNYGALGSDSPISIGILVNWCTLKNNSRMKLDNVHWERDSATRSSNKHRISLLLLKCFLFSSFVPWCHVGFLMIPSFLSEQVTKCLLIMFSSIMFN